MKGFALTSRPEMEILSAYSAPQTQIDAVTATPGWNVVGAFFLPLSIALRLELIGSVSVGSRVMRGQLFDLTALEPVGNTEVTITSLTDVRALSAIAQLTGNRTYQIQVEVTGGSTGFGVVREASPTV